MEALDFLSKNKSSRRKRRVKLKIDFDPIQDSCLNQSDSSIPVSLVEFLP